MGILSASPGLAHTIEHYADGRPHDGFGHARREKHHGADGHHVEHDRRQRREQEGPEGVQHAHGQRCHADEQKVREHHPRERRRQQELVPVVLELPAPGDEFHDVGREDDAEARDDDEDDQEPREDRVGKASRLVLRPLRQGLGEDRDEGRGHGPLGQQLAEQVRDAVGYIEGVGGRGSAEGPGHHHVADIPHDPGGERRSAYHASRLCNFYVLRHDRSPLSSNAGPHTRLPDVHSPPASP